MELNNKFHSITGESIGERRKNFNHIIYNLHPSESVVSLTPTTYLEELFKIDALILHNKDEELFNILKEGNYTLIHKVIKQGFQVLYHKIIELSTNKFVNEFFPCLSLSTKLKVLNKLCAKGIIEEKADELFTTLKDEYGLYLALKLLPCCSRQLIEDTSKLSRFYLDHKQLLFIVKIYPELTSTLIDSLVQKKYGKFEWRYKSVLNHIVETNPELYLQFAEKYKFKSQLSKRKTKRLIKNKRNEIVANLPKYKELLHFRQAEKILQTDLRDYFLDQVDDDVNEANVNTFVVKLHKLRNKKLHLRVLLECFKQKHGINLLEDPKLVTYNVLKLMSREQRIEYINAHARTVPTEAEWMACHSVDISIPYLKERISLSPKQIDRINLIQYLVETCALNKDENALKDVCHYFYNTHKNDACVVRARFVLQIAHNFPMVNFSEDLWDVIVKIMQLFIMRNEQCTMSPNRTPHFQYMRYLAKRGLSLRPAVELQTQCEYNFCTPFLKSGEYGYKCMECLLDVVPELNKTKEDCFWSMVLTVEGVVDWNKRHKKKLSLLKRPPFFEFLKEQMVDKSDRFFRKYQVFLAVIRQEPESKERYEFIQMFLNKDIINHLYTRFFLWLLKVYPGLVNAHFELVMKSVLTSYVSLREECVFKWFRNYAHLQFPQRILAGIPDIPLTDSEDMRMSNAFAAKLILAPYDFTQAVSHLLPDRNTELSEVDYNLFRVQTNLANSLIHSWQPLLISDVIIRYFNKTYMFAIVRALNATTYKLNENKLEVFLNHLEKEKVVSVNKHALYLYHQFCRRQTCEAYLTKAVDKEKNPSIRTVISRILFMRFTSSCSRSMWELFKKCFQTVSPKDREAVLIVLKVEKVPQEFLTEYIQFVWERLGTFEVPQEKMNPMKANFLKHWSQEVIAKLPHAFVLNILREHLFESSDKVEAFQQEIKNVGAKYLNSAGDRQEEVLREITNLARNYIENYWKVEVRVCALNLMNFFTACWQECAKDVFEKVKFEFEKILDPIEAYNELFFLEFALVSYNNTLEEIARGLIELFNKINPGLYNSVYEIMKTFVDKYLEKDERKNRDEKFFSLLHHIVTNCDSVNWSIMAFLMLEGEKVVSCKSKNLYNEIINVLKSNADDTVKIYYYNHVKKLV